jgi:mannitol 2-dehydrogenase
MDELMRVSSVSTNLLPLRNETLSAMPAAVTIPQYDRSKLTPGIVHIGVGNFHRAHFAWYMHRLMQQGEAMDWAIIGAGVRDHDKAMREKLLKQDGLTTLIELDPHSKQTMEITGAMIDYLPVEKDNHALIAMMAKPQIRIVSTTITEGGYYLDPNHNGLDTNHPDIRHDAENPSHPCTAFGAMIAALRLRRDQGIGPFTGLCCDNLQGNGSILRQTVVGLARLSDGDLADWIDQHCSFPTSMVDCIVPATGPSELARVQTIGIDDQAPVTHEPFRQWVIEDAFCAGRPDWDKVGAEFSDVVHLHEAQKIRILNGGHQVLANVAEVMGFGTISEAVAHPLIHAMFRKVQIEEIIPHVTPLKGMTILDYLNVIDQRFANPAIIDTVRRVAYDGVARHMGFILPTIRDGLKAGISINGLAMVEAAWARMCLGIREDGSVIEANDPSWDMLKQQAILAKERPIAWLEMPLIYGDLITDDRFADAFQRWLVLMYQDGMEATLRHYLGENKMAS